MTCKDAPYIWLSTNNSELKNAQSFHEFIPDTCLCQPGSHLHIYAGACNLHIHRKFWAEAQWTSYNCILGIDPDESHGTFPRTNVHAFNILCLISSPRAQQKSIHIPQVTNPENENTTALQFGVTELWSKLTPSLAINKTTQGTVHFLFHNLKFSNTHMMLKVQLCLKSIINSCREV